MRLMKRLILLAAVLTASFTGLASAQATEVGTARQYGFGFQIGEPTALTAKVFVNPITAFDFGLGFGGCHDHDGHRYRCGSLASYLSLHLDYLYQENILNRTNRLDWYVGLGGRVVVWADGLDDNGRDLLLIARVPVGLAVTFRRPSFLEVYLELAPGMIVFDYLDLAIDFGLGVRAYL